jgi:hypothetical protein
MSLKSWVKEERENMEPKKAGPPAGDEPQHSMKRKDDPGPVDAPKEAVGGPDQPGKPPERTPATQRGSSGKV